MTIIYIAAVMAVALVASISRKNKRTQAAEQEAAHFELEAEELNKKLTVIAERAWRAAKAKRPGGYTESLGFCALSHAIQLRHAERAVEWPTVILAIRLIGGLDEYVEEILTAMGC